MSPNYPYHYPRDYNQVHLLHQLNQLVGAILSDDMFADFHEILMRIYNFRRGILNPKMD